MTNPEKVMKGQKNVLDVLRQIYYMREHTVARRLPCRDRNVSRDLLFKHSAHAFMIEHIRSAW